MGKKAIFDALIELRALAALAPGSEDGSSKDLGGPSGLIRALCRITATAGTLTLTLEGSPDNSTWYEIPGTKFLDPTDGAIMNETGLYEVYFKNTYRYIRTQATVATGSVTFQVYLSKV